MNRPAELQKAHAEIWARNERGEITIRQAKDEYAKAEQEYYARHKDAPNSRQHEVLPAAEGDESPYYRLNPEELVESIQGAAPSQNLPGLHKRSREELGALANYLRHYAGLARAPAERRRLMWGAAALTTFLEGTAPSLEHAFGLVAKQGNPRGVTRWAERAAVADREGLTVSQVAARYGLADDKSVRDGLRRGREENERAEHAKVVREGAEALAAEFKKKGSN